MNLNDIDWFRTRLLEERDQAVAEIKTHDPGGVRKTGDYEDRASSLTEEMVESRITDDFENLLAKIDLALERLAAGTYQQCLECGGEIPLERLRAKPSVSLCIDCQRAKDAAR